MIYPYNFSDNSKEADLNLTLQCKGAKFHVLCPCTKLSPYLAIRFKVFKNHFSFMWRILIAKEPTILFILWSCWKISSKLWHHWKMIIVMISNTSTCHRERLFSDLLTAKEVDNPTVLVQKGKLLSLPYV